MKILLENIKKRTFLFKRNEQGITLQTVIVTAILAIGATAAGIFIYNAIADESDKVDDASVEIDPGVKYQGVIGGGACAYIGDDDRTPEELEELFGTGLGNTCLEVEREEPIP